MAISTRWMLKKKNSFKKVNMKRKKKFQGSILYQGHQSMGGNVPGLIFKYSCHSLIIILHSYGVPVEVWTILCSSESWSEHPISGLLSPWAWLQALVYEGPCRGPWSYQLRFLRTSARDFLAVWRESSHRASSRKQMLSELFVKPAEQSK